MHSPTQKYLALPALNTEDLDRYLYRSKKVALEELAWRRKDSALRVKIRSHSDTGSFPVQDDFKKPYAILFRQLATPTHEILRFLSLAKQCKLRPLIMEYYGDKFVSAGNTYKRSLGKMPIYQHTGTDGRDMVQFKTVFDFNKFSGKKISDIFCENGESLIDYHHRLFQKITKVSPRRTCVDGTNWLQLHGNFAPNYYRQFLALFVRDAVLFDNFGPMASEERFIRETVLPAFRSIEGEFGHAPLIIRLLPETEEARLFWDAYPKKIAPYL